MHSEKSSTPRLRIASCHLGSARTTHSQAMNSSKVTGACTPSLRSNEITRSSVTDAVARAGLHPHGDGGADAEDDEHHPRDRLDEEDVAGARERAAVVDQQVAGADLREPAEDRRDQRLPPVKAVPGLREEVADDRE